MSSSETRPEADGVFPWMPDFYCDDMYWMVSVDAQARGIFLLEADARRLFAAIDPETADGDVYLWRLNGGYLCRPHVEVRTIAPALPA